MHVVGIWALSYLYKNFCSEGLLHAVLGTGHSADGSKTIGDMVPKGILGLEVGFLSGVVQFALAVLYAAYLLLTMYRWIFVPSDSVHHYNTRDTGKY